MAASVDTAYLYIMSVPGGPCKVGYAMDTAKRLKQLQAQTGQKELVVLGKWPFGVLNARAAERYVHWLLRDKHYHGEWFNVSHDEAKAAIEQALATPLDARDTIPPIDVAGRKIINGESIPTKFPSGTRDAIRPLLGIDESRSDFIREAIEREIKRRQRAKPD